MQDELAERFRIPAHEVDEWLRRASVDIQLGPLPYENELAERYKWLQIWLMTSSER